LADWYIKQGDTYPPILAQLLDADGAAVNLTGALSVTIHVKERGSLLFSRACTVVTAATGHIRYDWQSGDTDTASDSCTIEFVVVWGNGTDRTTFPNDSSSTLQITRNLVS